MCKLWRIEDPDTGRRTLNQKWAFVVADRYTQKKKKIHKVYIISKHRQNKEKQTNKKTNRNVQSKEAEWAQRQWSARRKEEHDKHMGKGIQDARTHTC